MLDSMQIFAATNIAADLNYHYRNCQQDITECCLPVVKVDFLTKVYIVLLLFQIANAEIKIAERRRKSMVTVNNSIQLSRSSSLSRQRGIKSNENSHFRMQMEDIAECPESPVRSNKDLMEEPLSSTINQPEDASHEKEAGPPLEDDKDENAEEEITEADQALNAHQIIGENRCDSGFGEPGGSLSNRSSLLSSNSVRLPMGEDSPPPQCDAVCECGQLKSNCNSQGAYECTNLIQESENKTTKEIVNIKGNAMSSYASLTHLVC